MGAFGLTLANRGVLLGAVKPDNIHINPNRAAALEESAKFLNQYYTANFAPAFVAGRRAATAR